MDLEAWNSVIVVEDKDVVDMGRRSVQRTFEMGNIIVEDFEGFGEDRDVVLGGVCLGDFGVGTKMDNRKFVCSFGDVNHKVIAVILVQITNGGICVKIGQFGSIISFTDVFVEEFGEADLAKCFHSDINNNGFVVWDEDSDV